MWNIGSLSADTPSLATFLTVKAEDADLNSVITYSLILDDVQSGYFAMNQKGDIFTKKSVEPVS